MKLVVHEYSSKKVYLLKEPVYDIMLEFLLRKGNAHYKTRVSYYARNATQESFSICCECQ